MSGLISWITKFFEKQSFLSNPLIWPLISFSLTFLLVIIGVSGIRFPDYIVITLAVLLLFFATIAAPILGLIINFIYYPANEKYLRRLVLLYLSLLLLFANIYFLVALFLAPDVPFEGIHNAWVRHSSYEDIRLYWSNVFLTLADCLHFSCMTITTVGYGDMCPTIWYTKLITDLEVLLGLGVIVVGIGRYFSRLSSELSR
jgi:hypothetical protein